MLFQPLIIDADQNDLFQIAHVFNRGVMVATSRTTQPEIEFSNKFIIQIPDRHIILLVLPLDEGSGMLLGGLVALQGERSELLADQCFHLAHYGAGRLQG